MSKSLVFGAAATMAAALALAGASPASAACRGATTGTVVGGVGGALIGNAISHNAGGTILGGLGGAVVGHEIGRSGCGGSRTHAARGYRYERRGAGYADQDVGRAPLYYDRYGRPVSNPGGYADASYGGGCRTVSQDYYDARGDLRRRDVQVCGQ